MRAATIYDAGGDDKLMLFFTGQGQHTLINMK